MLAEPALQGARTDPGAVLKNESQAMSSLRLGKFSRALVVVQVALACGLMGVASIFVQSALQLKKESELALQFARSVPGLTTALVGMSRVEHVQANLALVGVAPASRDQFIKLFESRS